MQRVYKNREDIWIVLFCKNVKKYSHNGGKKSVPINMLDWSVYKVQHENIGNEHVLF